MGYPESRVSMSMGYLLCGMSSGLPHVLCIMHCRAQDSSIKARTIGSTDRGSENERRVSTGQLDPQSQEVYVIVGIPTRILCASVIHLALEISQA